MNFSRPFRGLRRLGTRKRTSPGRLRHCLVSRLQAGRRRRGKPAKAGTRNELRIKLQCTPSFLFMGWVPGMLPFLLAKLLIDNGVTGVTGL